GGAAPPDHFADRPRGQPASAPGHLGRAGAGSAVAAGGPGGGLGGAAAGALPAALLRRLLPDRQRGVPRGGLAGTGRRRRGPAPARGRLWLLGGVGGAGGLRLGHRLGRHFGLGRDAPAVSRRTAWACFAALLAVLAAGLALGER